jgi:hypothetical protein
MGNLVFQAALGGQVAVSGPNTASSYTINVPTVSGTFVTTGDTATVTSTMISGPLSVAVGGTGVTTSTGSGSNVLNTSPTLVTPVLGTPTSVTLTNATGLPLTTGVTGTLPVANGGTNLTSFTANGVVYASSTSALATGSNLKFDGSNLGVGMTPVYVLDVTGGNGNAIRFNDSSNSVQVAMGAYNSTGFFGTLNNFPQLFYANGLEKMRLTSAGYLGIGTNSPNRLLTVQATGTGNVANFQSNAGPNIAFTGTETSGRTYLLGEGLVTAGNFSIYDSTGSAERLVVDSSGNLGLGVTPSAWGLGHAFQISGSTGFLGFSGVNGNTVTNAYYDGSNYKYLANGYSELYAQSSGQHQWSVAPSGTTGNSVSFTQAMTLDNSGNLGIGTTSPRSVGGYTSLGLNNTTGVIVDAFVGGTRSSTIATTATDMTLGSITSIPLRFTTADTERARIDSSGNLLVNRTDAPNNGKICSQGGSNPALNLNVTTSSTYAAFVINNGTGSTNLVLFQSGTGPSSVGSITYNGTLTVYGTTSDVRLKENIVDAPQGNIDQIKVRSFDWKESKTHQKYGLIAQELQEVAPYAVSHSDNEDDMLNVDFSLLVPMMIKEIQQLKAEVAKLKGV